MNALRRKQIRTIQNRIADELTALINSIKEEIEHLRDEEQDCFDNMPENLQSGDKGDNAQAAIDSLQEACDNLDMIDLDAVTDALSSATQ